MRGMPPTQALILAGGRGLRARPATLAIPKPLLPLGDTVIVELLVKQISDVATAGMRISLGYMADHVRGYLDYRHPASGISYVVEQERLGTAGPISLLDVQDGPLLISNGDILTNIDFAALVRDHVTKAADITIVAIEHRFDLAYGRLSLDGAGRLTEWAEKPTIKDMISGGVYVLSPRACAMVPEATYFDMPDLVRAAMAAGCTVRTYLHPGLWYDLGSIADYEAAADHYARSPEAFEPTRFAAWAV